MVLRSPIRCPYCAKLAVVLSRDHIFPVFLGGHRKIPCCGGSDNCNSKFGHTFEAGAAKYLQTLHVFISSWGLPLRSVSPIWVAAYSHDGKPYDLEVGETGVRPILSSSSPHIQWDEKGKIASREFRTQREAELFAKHLLKNGKAKRVEIVAVSPPEIDMAGLGMELQLGPDIKRLALKISVAAATLLPHFTSESVFLARQYLTGARSAGYIVDVVLPAYDTFNELDSIRGSLCHLVYTVRARGDIWAVVQFFGVVQLYCRLGAYDASVPEAAILGTFDPVTGRENFSDAPIIQIPVPPFSIPAEIYASKLGQWLAKFRAEALSRGATHPPDLSIQSIRVER